MLNQYPYVEFLGACVHKGQKKQGVEYGSNKFKETNFFQTVRENGITITDHGFYNPVELENDEPVAGANAPRSFVATTLGIADIVAKMLSYKEANDKSVAIAHDGTRKLDDSVTKAMNRSRLGIVFGGDHSLAAGSIVGHTRVHDNVCVVWVDAHADINPPTKSQSGSTHGMPLAFILSELQSEIPTNNTPFADIKPCINASSLAYIGLRDVDQYEQHILDTYKIINFTSKDVKTLGIAVVLDKILKNINPDLKKSIHLSFDIDALDPIYAKSTGTPVDGGLSLQEGIQICSGLYKTGKLSLVDLAEVNPSLGTEKDVQQTLNSANALLLACLGISTPL